MITQLSGVLLEKELTRVVIDVNGVGYEVLIPMSTYDRLPRDGEPVTLRTKLVVREDLMQLYGFFTPTERELFDLVTLVSGIGPKLGLNVLSAMSVQSFCANIVNSNTKALSKISGVGKRTAERLVVELKDKIHAIAPSVAITGKAGDDKPEQQLVLSKSAEDAVSGLVTLGIKPESARKTVHHLIQDLKDDEITAEKLIRQALTALNS